MLGASVALTANVANTLTASEQAALTTATLRVFDQAGNSTTARTLILGSAASESLSGSSGNDILYGFGGNDSIDGGAGDDTMIGGGLSDVFITSASGGTSDAPTANNFGTTIAGGRTLSFANGVDVILDFALGTDLLQGRDAGAGLINLIGGSSALDFSTGRGYFSYGSWNASTAVFTLQSNWSSSNNDLLFVVGDAGALTPQTSTGYTVLVDISGAIDTEAPTITAFSSSTANGSYKAGDSITITATASETLQAGAQITATLDTGASVLLTAASTGTSLSGTYTIAAGQTSADLTVSSFTIGSGANTPLDTGFGNAMLSTNLPTGTNNIAGSKAIVIDTTAPAAPSFALASDTGGSSSDGLTNNGLITISGLESGASWDYSSDGGSTWSAGSGSSFTLAAGSYASGAIGVRQTDLAGNTTATPAQNSSAITVDSTAPNAPSITAIPESATGGTIDTSEASDGTTVQVSLSGSNAVAGDSLLINWGSQTSSISLNASDISAGSITVAISKAILDAQGNGSFNVTATLIDPAGNNSSPSTAVAVSVDQALTYTATTATDTPIFSSDNDRVIVTATNQISAADSFDGAGGSDTIQIGTPGDGVTVDLSGGGTNASSGFLNFEAIEFVNSSGSSSATFSADQFGAAEIPLNATIIGTSAGSQALTINLAAGGSFNASGLNFSSWTPGSDTFTLNGSSGNETITGSSLADVISGGGSADSLTGGGGRDIFAFASKDSTLTIAAGAGGNPPNTISGYDTISDYVTAATAGGAEIIQYTAAAIPANATVNGANANQKLRFNTGTEGKSHRISNGIVSFDDADTFASAVQLTSLSDVAAAIDYINGNDFGNSGSAIAFLATIAGVPTTFIYIQGDDKTSVNNDLIALPGVSASRLALAGPNQLAVLDDAPPAAPILALGTGVAGGASAAEATQASGVLSVSGEAGASISISFSRAGGGSVSKTITGSGSAQAVVLSSADLTSLGEGTISVSATATDAIGNTSSAGTTSFVLDSTAPAPLSLTAPADSGVSSSDGITRNSSFTVSGLEAGASWQLSTNNGGSWTSGSGSSFTLTDASYAPGALQVRQIDAAGNIGPASTNSTAITIDTVAPSLTGIFPAQGVTAVPLNTGIVISYSEAIYANGGTVNIQVGTSSTNTFAMTLTAGASSGSFSTGSGSWAIAGNKLYIKPAANFAARSIYNVDVSATALVDAAGNAYGGITSTNTTNNRFTTAASATDITAPTVTVTTFAFSADTAAANTSGTSSDFITNVASQTISGSLSSALAADELLQLSLDNGSSWRFASATGTAFSLSGVTLPGSNTLRARVIDAAGNAGTARIQAYVLDQSAAAPGLTLGSGLSPAATAAVALQSTGVVSVSGESGAAIAVTFSGSNGSLQKTLTANGSAQAVTLSAGDLTSLGDGSISVSAVQTDLAGNTSAAGTTTFVLDTLAPLAPSLALAADTGSSSADRLTSNATITVGGLETSANWHYSINSGGSWTAGSGSSFAVAAGSYSAAQVQVRQTDLAGNLSPANTGFAAFTVDTSAAAPTLALAADTGSSSSDRTTGNATLTISGLESGASWEFSTNSGGSWTTGSGSSFAVAPGSYSAGEVQVRQTDLAGNLSPSNTAFAAFTVDTAAAAPTLSLAEDTGSSSDDRISSDGTINLSGLETGATWEYSVNNGGSWTAGSGSSFAVAPGSFSSGQVQVRQTDLAGNLSPANTTFAAFTVDTTAAAPTLSLAEDTGSPSDDRITNNASITISGLEAGASWEYSVNNGGSWSTGSGSSFAVAAGSYSTGQVQIRQTDLAGNLSPANTDFAAFTVDTSAAAAPSLALAADTGSSSSDRISSNATINLSGLETGASWEYSVNKGGSWTPGSGSSFAVAAGSYSAGQVQVRQTDLAGNLSPVNSGFAAFTVDTAAAAPSLALAADTGSSSSDRITSNASISISGLESGASWEFSSDGGGSWSAGSGSSFAVAASAYSAGQVQLRQTDLAGNLSPAHTSFAAFKVDTTAPATPQITSAAISSTTTPTISGTAEAGSTITIAIAGATYATTSIGGYWSLNTGLATPVSGTLSISEYSGNNIAVTASDAAGNVSAAANQTLLVDTSNPVLSISLPISIDGYVNDGEDETSLSIGGSSARADGSTVNVTVGGSTTSGTIASGGAWSVSLTSAQVKALTPGIVNVTANVTNLGGYAAAPAAATFIYSPTAPTISSIALSSASGSQNNSLNAGDGVTATVTMSSPVSVSGSPTLQLTLGSTAVTATYDATNSTETALRFNATILAGQTDANGIAIAANSLALNGSSIVDVAGNAATLSHASVADNDTYRVDTTAPAAPSAPAETDSSKLADGFLNSSEAATSTSLRVPLGSSGAVAGDNVELLLNGASLATPKIATLSATDISEGYASFTFSTADLGADGSKSLTAKLTDAAGNAAPLSAALGFSQDTTAATINSVAITSASGSQNSTLNAGDGVTATVTMGEAVNVSGSPTLQLTIGSTAVMATYDATSSTATALRFNATILAGQTDADGIAIAANSIALNGGTINDAAGNPANLSHGAVSNDNSFLVDTTTPNAPVLSLGAGISGSATAVEATAAGGIVSLTAEAGASVTVNFWRSGGGSVSKSVSGNGTSAVPVVLSSDDLTTIGDGSIHVSATATDAAGNSSTAGATSFSLDTQVAAPTLALLSDTGGSSTDKLTNSGNLNITGIESGAVVECSANGASGWSTTAPALSQGSNTVYVRQKDVAGNVSAATAFSFSYDNQIAAPTVALLSDSGSSSSDKITSSGSLTVTGTEPAAVVEYSSNGSSGWSTTAPALNQGSNTVYVRQTDLAGNISSATAFTFTFDSQAGALSVALNSDSGSSSSDKITSSGSLSITGTESGALVEYSANGSSGWSSTAPALSQGSNTVYLRQTDLAGNVSATTAFSFTFDSQVSAPSVALSSDSGSSSSDQTTSIGTLTITGIESDAVVEYSANGSSGWSTTAPALNQGSNTVYVRQTDLAGNVSATTAFSFTFDNQVSAPTVALTSDTGSSSSDQITSIGTLTITGIETDAVVEYSANGSSGWSSTAPALSQGSNTVYVRQTDGAGNVSAATAFSFTFDSQVAAPSVALSSDTGSSSSDRISSIGTLSISGSEAGALVEYSANGSSGWSSTAPALSQGSNSIFVRQTDLAGNISATTAFSFSFDSGAANVALSSQSAQLVEAGGGLNSQAGTPTATITLSRSDSTTTASFDTSHLTAIAGWGLASGTIYTKSGSYGNASFDTASGVITYTLSNSSSATQALTQGQSVSDGFGVIRVVDTADNSSDSSSVAFSITGSNDAPVLSSSLTNFGAGSEDVVYSVTTAQLLAGYSDVDSSSLAIINLSATNATISTPVAGVYTLTPTPNFNGNVSLSYSVSDGLSSRAASNTIVFSSVNDAPTFTSLSTPLASGASNTEIPISFSSLAAQGNEADVDGSVVAFVVQSVSSGSLKIGASSGTATPFAIGSNDRIDASRIAYWTPAINASGNLTAFSVVARDDSGSNSATALPVVLAISAPSAPTAAVAITAIINDTGSSNSDFITNDRTLILQGSNGSLASGVKIQVSANGISWFDANSTSSTTWTYNDTNTNRSGSVTYQARVVDAFGNVGNTALRVVTIDTTAPSVTITSVGGGDGTVSGNAGDNLVIGTAEPSRSVSLFNGGSLLGSTSTDASGAFSYSLTAANISSLGQGNRSISASQTDVAGNSGSGSFWFDIDTIAPSAPTINTVAGDNIINSSERAAGFNLSGSGGANNLISISWGGFSRTTSANSSGNWSLGYSSAFIPGDGSSTISVTATDGAGNVSSAGSRTLLIDTLAPLAPTIAVVASDDRINSSEKSAGITLSGTAEANSAINISWGGASRATTTNASGAWSLLYAGNTIPTDADSSLISVTAADSAGNVTAAATRTVLIDTIAPGTPSIAVVAGDDVINAAEKALGFSVSGTNGINNTITVSWGGITRTTSSDDSGNWSLIYASNLVPADSDSSTISVTATDLAGNRSDAGSRRVEIDSTAPNAPVIDALTGDDVISVSEQAAGFTLRGSSEARNTININWNGINHPATTNGSGAWNHEFSATEIPGPGSFSFSVTATDDAGNVSPAASRTVTISAPVVVIEVTAPTAAVAITGITNDSETPDDFITNDTSLTISGSNGTLNSGEKVQISGDNATWIDTTATSASSWSYTDPTQRTSSLTYQVRVINSSNIVGNTASQLVTIDTTAPAAPVITDFATDTGIRHDNITSNTTPTLSIKAEVGSSVTVLRDGISVGPASAGTTSAGSQGDYSFASAGLADGTYTFTVIATDLAGNVSTASSSLPITIDTTASKPGIMLEEDTGSSASDGLTRNGTVLVYGLESGATWAYSLNGGGRWITSSGGSFRLNPGSYAADAVQVRQIDAAGNVSDIGSFSQALTIDLVVPTIAISSSKASLGLLISNGSAYSASDTVTFTLSELCNDFDSSDISVSGGSLGPLSVDSSGLVYSALFTPSFNSAAPGVISVASGRFSDSAGNTNTDGADANNSVTYAVNTLAPTDLPTISLSSSLSSLKAGETATLTFTLSKLSTDFSSSSVTVTGGSLGALSADASGLIYTGSFTPTPSSGSTATIAVASGRFTDSATGLANQDGNDANNSLSLVVDTVAPSVRATSVSFSNDSGTPGDLITNSATQTISGSLSGALADGEVVSVSLDNGHTWTNASAAAGATSYSIEGLTLINSNTLRVSVFDAVANVDPSNTLIQAYTYKPSTWSGSLSLLNYAGTVAVTGVASGNDNSFDLSLPGRDSNTSVLYQISLDGGNTWSNTNAAQSSLPDGTYTFRGRVTDVAGNQALSTPVTVVVDATPPAAPILALNGLSGTISAAQLSQSSGAILVTAESGSSVAVTLTSSGGGSLSRTLTGSGGAQAIVLSAANVASLNDGTLTVTARATDPAGNQGAAADLSFAYVAQPVIGALSISKGQDGNEAGTVPMTFIVSRTGSPAQALTAFYRFTNLAGSVTAGVDYSHADASYVSNGYGTVSFAAGSSTATISLPVIDNSTVNSTRTLLATLINAPLGYTLSSAQGSASASILDNDVAVVVPVVSMTSAAMALPEGNNGATTLNMVVNLSAATTVSVNVAWSLVNGTATYGSDYNASAQSGTLSFAAGETSKSISISILGDTTVETDETFQFVISSPTNATLSGDGGSLSRTVTITNDDVAVVVDPNAGITTTLAGGTYTASDKNDVITGSAGVDTISLRGGNDWVEALGGADVISGGSGADIFVYRNAAHSNSTSMDRLTDFSPIAQGDRIALTTLPERLWNAGTMSGTSASTVMATALASAPTDARVAGSAIMVSMGTTATYIVVSDGVSGLGFGDIAIQSTLLPRSSDASNPFNTSGYLNPSMLFTST